MGTTLTIDRFIAKYIPAPANEPILLRATKYWYYWNREAERISQWRYRLETLTNIFPEFTAFENCRLAAQSRAPRVLHVMAPAERYLPTRAAAEAALHESGLAHAARQRASAMSHGEQRQLEIAMVLATSPDVLLLDEPLAGMGAEEALRMVELLKRLRGAHAILLVEHDMDAVFAVADRITVMVEGKVLESGLPDAIRRSPKVREAYLGSETH